MSFNLIHRTVIGDTGKTLTTPLYDTDPVTRQPRAIDLTGATVTISITTKSGVAIVNNGACTITSAVGGTISFAYNATVASLPNLVKGDHHIRFKIVTPDTSVTYIPADAQATYGVFRVIE